MSKHPLLIGIDIGTSSIKAALVMIHEDEKRLEVIESVSQPLKIIYGPGGKVEQIPEEYFRKSLTLIKQLIRKAHVNASHILGIGISSQCPTIVLLDKEGYCLDNAILYMDRRAKDACELVVNKLGFEALFNLTKNIADPYFGGYKLIWLAKERKELYDSTEKILSVNSFLAYKFCGNHATDWITACTFAPFFDWSKRGWNESLLNDFGLSSEKFPEKIIPPYEIVGLLKPELARKLGLTREIPIIIGTCDAQAAALAGGAVSENNSIMICGTTHLWELIHSQQTKFSKHFINCLYIFPGLYLSAAALMTTGAILEWFLRNFIGVFKGYSKVLRILESHAREIRPGSDGLITLPYFMGERSPIWDPGAKGLIFGLTLRHEVTHIYRSILEGVAFALKSCKEIFESLDLLPDEIIAIDGAAKNILWMEIISSVLEIPIKRPKPELGSAAGAAMLAGYGIRIFKKPEDIRQFISYESIAEPDLEKAREYEKNYQIFKDLYWRLREYMHKL
ncbi:MAG: FGGY family carbohydrate kinase [Desulfurococcaceae archaeon]